LVRYTHTNFMSRCSFSSFRKNVPWHNVHFSKTYYFGLKHFSGDNMNKVIVLLLRISLQLLAKMAVTMAVLSYCCKTNRWEWRDCFVHLYSVIRIRTVQCCRTRYSYYRCGVTWESVTIFWRWIFIISEHKVASVFKHRVPSASRELIKSSGIIRPWHCGVSSVKNK